MSGRIVVKNTTKRVNAVMHIAEIIPVLRYALPARILPLFFSIIPIMMPTIGSITETMIMSLSAGSFGSTGAFPFALKFCVGAPQ